MLKKQAIQLRWSELAIGDLLEIVTYIAEDNPVAAFDVDEEIHRQVELLVTHPKIGRPGRIKGTKELVISNLSYVLPYLIDGDSVEILRVYHTSRLWPKSIRDLESSN
jgi:addiction module RelE/StbE family toxin